MANLLTSTVMNALMGAASHAQNNRFCTTLSQMASARGDDAAAESAKGYANSYRDKAMSATEQARQALAERAEEARAEERLEQQQRIEAAQAETRVETETAQAADVAVESIPQPAAVFVPSQAYQNSRQTDAGTEAVNVEPAPAAQPAVTAKAYVPEVVAPAAKSAPQISLAVAGAASRKFTMDIRV